MAARLDDLFHWQGKRAQDRHRHGFRKQEKTGSDHSGRSTRQPRIRFPSVVCLSTSKSKKTGMQPTAGVDGSSLQIGVSPPHTRRSSRGMAEEGWSSTTRVLTVVAISGSLRRASANTGLIRAAAEICSDSDSKSIPGLRVHHVDISALPLLNPDLEAGGAFPPPVQAFRDHLRAADCFLLASPEYNYSISGPLKNALDWGSRPPNCWADRAAAILSASGGSGGSRSQYHIRQVGVFLDMHFVNKPEVFTKAHQPPDKFDDDGNLVDPETREQVRKLLLALRAFALRLQHQQGETTTV